MHLGLQCITFVSMVNYKSPPLFIEINFKLNTAIVAYILCSQLRKLSNEQPQKHQSTEIKNIESTYLYVEHRPIHAFVHKLPMYKTRTHT